jgi:hypothetical protein
LGSSSRELDRYRQGNHRQSHAELGASKQCGIAAHRAWQAAQNAYIESCNGRLRDEYLNDHWFVSLAHARIVIEAWRREYNDERPKRALGGLTPSAYARQLAAKVATLTVDSKAVRY